jgi:hypothetical protein
MRCPKRREKRERSPDGCGEARSDAKEKEHAMTGIASLFGLALAVSVVFAVWRISTNVRKIREHLDFIAPAMRSAWKHQGIEFAPPAEIYYSEGWWRLEGTKRYGPYSTREEATSSSAPPAAPVNAETTKPFEQPASNEYRDSMPGSLHLDTRVLPAKLAPSPPRQLQTLNFSGSGGNATFPADFEKALYTFKLTHAGHMDFAVWVMDPAGNRVELLVDTIGPFSGSKAVQIPAKGRYVLDVSADGEWTITAGAP